MGEEVGEGKAKVEKRQKFRETIEFIDWRYSPVSHVGIFDPFL